MIIGTVTKIPARYSPHVVFMFTTYARGYYYAFRKIGPLWYLWAELDEDMVEENCKMGFTELAQAFETKEDIERYLARKDENTHED